MTRSSPVDTVNSMDAIVILAPRLPEYLSLALADGSTPYERFRERLVHLRKLISEGRPDAPVCYVAAPGPAVDQLDKAEDWHAVSVAESGDASALFHALDTFLPAEIENLVLLWIDAPLFSPRIAAYLLTLQHYAVCDYTFGDGYPAGFAPEVLRRDALSGLSALSVQPQIPWERSVVFDALSRDINAFDVETEAARDDLDLLRLSLTVDVRGNYLFCRRLCEREGTLEISTAPVPDPRSERFDQESEPVLRLIQESPELRRTLPFYLQVQLGTELLQRPFYLPEADPQWSGDAPGSGSHMSRDLWRRLLSELAEWAPETTLSIGYRGEVSLHPEFPELLRDAAAYERLSLFVETSGLGWSEAATAALDGVTALIVELDAIEPAQYERIRGEGRDEALRFIEAARSRIPGRVYVQATRMRENEWELQEFFNHWDAVEGVTPLIQKYNDFAGRLEQRQVADMAPISRIPCWHLQRDMVLLHDGTVVRCLQDLDQKAVRGSFAERSLQDLWDAGAEDMDAHLRAEYPGMCRSCDEYYTFNA